jgi:hypothetical protein
MPPNRLDPQSAAEFAIIAIALVMIGALLTTGVVSVEQRAVVLGATITVLLTIAYRRRRKDDAGE